MDFIIENIWWIIVGIPIGIIVLLFFIGMFVDDEETEEEQNNIDKDKKDSKANDKKLDAETEEVVIEEAKDSNPSDTLKKKNGIPTYKENVKASNELVQEFIGNDEKIISTLFGLSKSGSIYASSALIATNKQIIHTELHRPFLSPRKGALFLIDTNTFQYNSIKGVKTDISGISEFNDIILISKNDEKYELTISRENKLEFDESKRIVDYINKMLNPIAQNQNVSVADELIKLNELKEKGILSEVEFAEQKKKLIKQ